MIEPLGDSVLVQVDTPKDKTKSGLFIKEDWETRPPTGIVKAVGPWVEDVETGDRIIFMRYGSIETHEKDLRLIQQSHILAKIND